MSYYDTSYPPSLWETPPVIVPNGVIPGTPGSFQPIGATAPANLIALQGLGALGETIAWTTGQYVVLGDASNANWNGTGWVTGIHAGVEEPETFTAIPVDNPPEDLSDELL